MHRVLRVLVASTIALSAVLGAAGCNNHGEVALPDARKVAEPGEEGSGEPSKAPPEASQISEGLYPELPLGLLSNKEREALVRITKAQLCPCPKSSVSMHECLQKVETQCGLAMSGAMTVMQKLKEGNSERDALGALGAYIDSSYKKHDFDLEGVAYLGNPKAPVVIVEFADFECPFCNMARSIVKEVLTVHGDDVVVYYKHFPLGTHEHSFSASCATLAAQKQGKFWEMYNLIFDNQKSLSEEKIRSLAQALGLNMDQFLKDWKDAAVAERVEKEKQEGAAANVDSTPTFFINGRKFLGDKTPGGLLQAVSDELKDVQKK